MHLVTSQIRKWVLDRGPGAKRYWGRSLQEILPAINGRLIRLYGFNPWGDILGYTPEWQMSSDPNSNIRGLPATPDVRNVTGIDGPTR